MPSLWFLLWFVLSAALLGFLGWTVLILLRQKAAWKSFADRHKLRYVPRQFFQTPEISGSMDGYTVSLFSGEHMAEDFRGTRKLSAIEINLSSVMPVSGAVASGGMVSVARGLQLKEEFRPDHAHWDKSYIASAESARFLQAYLTPERLQALLALMKIKNAWVILIFRDEVTLLRFDTPDPLDKPEKIERIVKKMIESARVLELKQGEDRRLQEVSTQKAPKNVALEIEDEDIKNASSIRLEDDEP